MALLDHQVPEEAKQVTVDLLQKCVGNLCVIKYWTEELITEPRFILCGMVTSMLVPANRGLEDAKITFYPGPSDPIEIPGKAIEYIYSLSMLPGTMPADMSGLMGPLPQVS